MQLIKLSNNGYLVYENGSWILEKVSLKESGKEKRKSFTFVSLYDIFLGAKRFVDIDSPESLEQVKISFALAVKEITQCYKDLKADKIDFFVKSSIKGPDHESKSLKNGVIAQYTRSTDSDMSNEHFVTFKRFPGNQKQSAIQMLVIEMGEIAQSKNITDIADMAPVILEAKDLVLEGLRKATILKASELEDEDDTKEEEDDLETA